MNQSNIILGIVALLVLGAAGYMLFGRSPESVVTITGAPASQAESTFVSLAAELNPVEFDTSILQDPRFMALVDIKTAIVPEPAGRIDPFAPLGAR